MFDLEMRTFQKPLLTEQEIMFDLDDRLESMRRKEETTYRCRDYLRRRNLRKGKSAKERKNDLSTFTSGCRRKMCEWSYHVIDFYRADRSIVAEGFDILDRFLDGCDCDRTVFKLASITCLYIASKSRSHRHLSLKTLAELSSGDFDENHFKRMERIILDVLDWRINGPTAGTFVDHLVPLIPIGLGQDEQTLAREISARAHFFAELSLLDYSFVPKRSSEVALASVMNALEGLQLSSHVSRELRERFSREVDERGLLGSQSSLDAIQERLWKLYRETEQCRVHDENHVPAGVGGIEQGSDSSLEDRITSRKAPTTDDSPVCVNLDDVDLTQTYSL